MSGLRRQDAEANIGAADGPKGKPQDAARYPATCISGVAQKSPGPGFRRDDDP